MTYHTNDVVRIAHAHHTYLDSLLTHAASFPKEEWFEKGRHDFLKSERYLTLTSAYEADVPQEVREQLRPKLRFLLERILDPKYDKDIDFEIGNLSLGPEEHDEGEGND